MAEHLFFVSLKYTKTGDVILNLIKKWEEIIDLCVDMLIKVVKKKRKMKIIPSAPRAKEILVRNSFRNPLIKKVMDMHFLFRKMPNLEKIRDHEFRKNVTVKVIDAGKEININMDKLKEWKINIDIFLKFVQKTVEK